MSISNSEWAQNERISQCYHGPFGTHFVVWFVAYLDRANARRSITGVAIVWDCGCGDSHFAGDSTGATGVIECRTDPGPISTSNFNHLYPSSQKRVMNLFDFFTIIMTASGVFFFFAGTVGLLRFPDVFCRLHSLTKVDNLGLGLIVLGVLPQLDSGFDAAQLILIWLLIMVASSVSCYLIANQALTTQHAKIPIHLHRAIDDDH
jgi:multicomponent Na+:H+ antiporter subunit G